MPNRPLQPTCQQCSEPMELARTAPFKAYDDIEDRTYQCPKCGHSEAWVVKEL
jgi:DNA-directed RNA polymerase subunit RPC12/RpoP